MDKNYCRGGDGDETPRTAARIAAVAALKEARAEVELAKDAEFEVQVEQEDKLANVGLVPIKYLYHVTHAAECAENIVNHGFGLSKATDKSFDGKILAASNAPKGIFFHSSLHMGKLPTRTEYPRDGVVGQKYPLLKVNIRDLHLEDCSLFLVKEPTTASASTHVIAGTATGESNNNSTSCEYKQIHLAVIHKRNQTALQYMLDQKEEEERSAGNGNSYPRQLNKQDNSYLWMQRIGNDVTWYSLDTSDACEVVNIFYVPAPDLLTCPSPAAAVASGLEECGHGSEVRGDKFKVHVGVNMIMHV